MKEFWKPYLSKKYCKNALIDATKANLWQSKKTHVNPREPQQSIASVVRVSSAITTDGIDEKLIEFQQELVKKANNKEAYNKIVKQIFDLTEFDETLMKRFLKQITI